MITLAPRSYPGSHAPLPGSTAFVPGTASSLAARRPVLGLSSRPATRGLFTLIELLVVVGIIAILAGLLLPVLARARQKAMGTNCTNAVHQIGLGVQMYCHDNGEKLPEGAVLGQGTSNLYLRSIPAWNGPTGLGLAARYTDPSGRLFYQAGNHAFGGMSEITHADYRRFLNPPPTGNFNVSSHYYFSQSGHNRPARIKVDPAGTALLIGNNGVSSAGTMGRYNHGGSGTHVLAADGHVKWIPTRGPEDLTTRFNRATTASADRALANADDGLR